MSKVFIHFDVMQMRMALFGAKASKKFGMSGHPSNKVLSKLRDNLKVFRFFVGKLKLFRLQLEKILQDLIENFCSFTFDTL